MGCYENCIFIMYLLISHTMYNNIKEGYSHKNPIKLLIIPIHRA